MTYSKHGVVVRHIDRLHSKEKVYHTNVMMSVGNIFAVICSEAITNETERETV